MTSSEVVAFAKLLGDNNFVYYMTTENVTLGRHAGSADIVLGENKNISRCHARIQFSRPKQVFELSCMSKNGAFVDGDFIGPSNPPAQLRSKALIQIGPRLIYFLLPKNVATSNSASDDEEGSVLSKAGPQGIRITQRTSTAGKKWSRTSREKVRCALMRFGYGRWDVLSEAVDDRDYTLSNLQIYTSQLVQQLVENCDDPTLKTGLIEILNSAPIELCNPDVFEPSLSGWSSLQKNVKKWSTRLILLYELKASTEMFGEASLLTGIGSIKGRSLGPHWDSQEDLDLCIGIYRHGFGEFNAILNDESLCFKGKWAARQDVSKGDLDDDEDIVSQTIPESNLPAPVVENATQQSDSDQQSSLPEWPQHLALIGRLKRILELLRIKRGKHSSQKAGKKRKDVPELASEDAKRLKIASKKVSVKKGGAKTENTLGWTRKDQASFQRGIIAQGHPESWAALRVTQPMLAPKTDNDLDQYYQKFLEAVDRVVVHRDAPDGGHLDSSPITDEALLFSFGVAVKIRERIDLFQSLRVLVEQQKEALCENAITPEPPFNEWTSRWTPSLDYALLRAILQYGISSWHLVWADEELPFASSGLSVPSEPKILVKRAQQLISRFGLEFDVSSQKSKYVPRNPSQRGEVASQPTFGPDGTPNMPIQVTSSLRILNLGIVPPGRDFRDGKHVFPVGFQAEREYPSLADPNRRCKYLCEVLQEDGRLKFKVTCADLPDEPIVADKPTHVWKQIETRLDTRRSTTRKRSTINGVEKFGLNHPLVMSLLLEDLTSAPRNGKAQVETEKSGTGAPSIAQLQPVLSAQSSGLSAPAPVSDYDDAPMDAESGSLGEEGDDEDEEDEEDEEGDSSDIDLDGSDADDDPGQQYSET